MEENRGIFRLFLDTFRLLYKNFVRLCLFQGNIVDIMWFCTNKILMSLISFFTSHEKRILQLHGFDCRTTIIFKIPTVELQENTYNICLKQTFIPMLKIFRIYITFCPNIITALGLQVMLKNFISNLRQKINICLFPQTQPYQVRCGQVGKIFYFFGKIFFI